MRPLITMLFVIFLITVASGMPIHPLKGDGKNDPHEILNVKDPMEKLIRKLRQVIQPGWTAEDKPPLFGDTKVTVTEDDLKETKEIRDSIQRKVDKGIYTVDLEAKDFVKKFRKINTHNADENASGNVEPSPEPKAIKPKEINTKMIKPKETKPKVTKHKKIPNTTMKPGIKSRDTSLKANSILLFLKRLFRIGIK